MFLFLFSRLRAGSGGRCRRGPSFAPPRAKARSALNRGLVRLEPGFGSLRAGVWFTMNRGLVHDEPGFGKSWFIHVLDIQMIN